MRDFTAADGQRWIRVALVNDKDANISISAIEACFEVDIDPTPSGLAIGTAIVLKSGQVLQSVASLEYMREVLVIPIS